MISSSRLFIVTFALLFVVSHTLPNVHVKLYPQCSRTALFIANERQLMVPLMNASNCYAFDLDCISWVFGWTGSNVPCDLASNSNVFLSAVSDSEYTGCDLGQWVTGGSIFGVGFTFATAVSLNIQWVLNLPCVSDPTSKPTLLLSFDFSAEHRIGTRVASNLPMFDGSSPETIISGQSTVFAMKRARSSIAMNASDQAALLPDSLSCATNFSSAAAIGGVIWSENYDGRQTTLFRATPPTSGMYYLCVVPGDSTDEVTAFAIAHFFAYATNPAFYRVTFLNASAQSISQTVEVTFYGDGLVGGDGFDADKVKVVDTSSNCSAGPLSASVSRITPLRSGGVVPLFSTMTTVTFSNGVGSYRLCYQIHGFPWLEVPLALDSLPLDFGGVASPPPSSPATDGTTIVVAVVVVIVATSVVIVLGAVFAIRTTRLRRLEAAYNATRDDAEGARPAVSIDDEPYCDAVPQNTHDPTYVVLPQPEEAGGSEESNPLRLAAVAADAVPKSRQQDSTTDGANGK